MEYNFKDIESRWQAYWQRENVYQVTEDPTKPKFYVLDMFPYPSGAGLHVGHPLGYIASDIFSRYKRLKGFNVLHPMGYDSFGLPAEQYAIQTGQHPAITTNINIRRYREQLDKIGFSYDWSREIRTSDPAYYRWTQWAFIQMFNHYFDTKSQSAQPIELLIEHFNSHGTNHLTAAHSLNLQFNAIEWMEFSEQKQQQILLHFRLAYLADSQVNWCPALGTVLANDEVVNGVSERGGHPVIQKEMKQWSLRISAYAQRLLDGLNEIDWTESLKEIQRNWIGRSEGAEMKFPVKNSEHVLDIFTTRPDTSWGVTFMVLAPENKLVSSITTPEYLVKVNAYIEESQKRSERERMADAKTISGQFTGTYAINPLSGAEIPIFISDYVLMGYGTGAIMAVPAHDSRDFKFARYFNLPIIQVIVAPGEAASDTSGWEDSFDAKEGTLVNSGFINGLKVMDAIQKTIHYIESKNIGKGKINYRLRDAIFSRQRYWGEPFPIYFKDGLPYPLEEDQLPLELPEVDKFLPTEDGQPPLGRAQQWQTTEGNPFELSTMPGFAGSSAYMYRYMDPSNQKALVSKEANNYWKNVDLYLGGAEHATGHLIYSRFWNKFLYDLGLVCEDEPFKKLINQGMIQGRSSLVYRIQNSNTFVTLEKIAGYEVTPIHIDVNIIENDILNLEAFKLWRPEFESAEFILNEHQQYKCGYQVEKMSKRYYNVVNPDDIVEKYGADTLRMYEMFLGPLDQSKPWDTNGIDGVHKFLRKFWRLFFNREGQLILNEDEAERTELKILHKTIKKVSEDIERFNFNTSVSAFMICVNELGELNCHKRSVLEPLCLLLSPFAPHLCEEIWHQVGHTSSVVVAQFPEFDDQFLVEDHFEYPVSFNGKLRFKIELSVSLNASEIEKIILSNEQAQKWFDGKAPKKIVVVPNRIINVVL
jgi:leucyl-tRNA synthetase